MKTLTTRHRLRREGAAIIARSLENHPVVDLANSPGLAASEEIIADHEGAFDGAASGGHEKLTCQDSIAILEGS